MITLPSHIYKSNNQTGFSVRFKDLVQYEYIL